MAEKSQNKSDAGAETPLEQGMHLVEDIERAAVAEGVSLANDMPNLADEAVANLDRTIDRIRRMNEEMIEAASSSSHRVLDTYEQTLRTMLDWQLSVAESTQIGWVNAMARAQAQFMLEVSNFYTKAARDMLG